MSQKYTDFISTAVINALCAYVEGQRSEWEEMGFSEDEMRWLSTLTATEVMQFCAACRRIFKWGGINHQAFVIQRKVFEQQRCVDDKQKTLIGLKAPVTLMTYLFGLESNGCTDLRKKLDLELHVGGRPRSLTEVEQIIVWRAWEATKGQDEVDRILAVGKTVVPLDSAWQLLRQMIDKDEVEADQEVDKEVEQAT